MMNEAGVAHSCTSSVSANKYNGDWDATQYTLSKDMLPGPINLTAEMAIRQEINNTCISYQ
jgi:hypothetical protein